MKRRRRVNPKEDAKYYVQTGCDKGSLDILYINAYKGKLNLCETVFIDVIFFYIYIV